MPDNWYFVYDTWYFDVKGYASTGSATEVKG